MKIFILLFILSGFLFSCDFEKISSPEFILAVETEDFFRSLIFYIGLTFFFTLLFLNHIKNKPFVYYVFFLTTVLCFAYSFSVIISLSFMSGTEPHSIFYYFDKYDGVINTINHFYNWILITTYNRRFFYFYLSFLLLYFLYQSLDRPFRLSRCSLSQRCCLF